MYVMYKIYTDPLAHLEKLFVKQNRLRTIYLSHNKNKHTYVTR